MTTFNSPSPINIYYSSGISNWIWTANVSCSVSWELKIFFYPPLKIVISHLKSLHFLLLLKKKWKNLATWDSRFHKAKKAHALWLTPAPSTHIRCAHALKPGPLPRFYFLPSGNSRLHHWGLLSCWGQLPRLDKTKIKSTWSTSKS